jgi:hypothetical protein
MNAEKQCQGVLNIAGENYRCDQRAGHDGVIHTNQKAKTIWCGGGKGDTK